uniref:Uncharacterized protein n=1 Tax=Pararge aegeria TaxID=116150 RepID=S4P7X7_9NEOP
MSGDSYSLHSRVMDFLLNLSSLCVWWFRSLQLFPIVSQSHCTNQLLLHCTAGLSLENSFMYCYIFMHK